MLVILINLIKTSVLLALSLGVSVFCAFVVADAFAVWYMLVVRIVFVGVFVSLSAVIYNVVWSNIDIKISVLLAILTTGCILAALWCHRSGWCHGYDYYIFKRRLNNALEAGASAIRVSDLTNFQWDHVCFYCPYAHSSDNPNVSRDEGKHTLLFWSGQKSTFVTYLYTSQLLEYSICALSEQCFGLNATLVISEGRVASIIN